MGPLHGITVIEFAGIGPGPFAAMLFADMGAEVVRIERKRRGAAPVEPAQPRPFRRAASRGRRAVTLDLKRPPGAAALRLIDRPTR
jgi:alpha-methylacyl-CoA racemase